MRSHTHIYNCKNKIVRLFRDFKTKINTAFRYSTFYKKMWIENLFVCLNVLTSRAPLENFKPLSYSYPKRMSVSHAVRSINCYTHIFHDLIKVIGPLTTLGS